MMAEDKEVQFEQWLKHRTAEKIGDGATDASAFVMPSAIPDLSEEPVTDGRHLPPPLLSGKLADYLSQKTPRNVHGTQKPFSSKNVALTISDTDVRAAVAMSVILASHLTRFASTTVSETALLQFREQILKTFGAHDAVRLEVEAYDLLKWFAGAMDASWEVSVKADKAHNDDHGLLDHLAVLQRAIDEKLDLDMSYYTGTRGEFSTRRITPLEICAEKYLMAYCHTRKEKRRFRLSRIVSLNWVQPQLVQASLFENEADDKSVACAQQAADVETHVIKQPDAAQVEALDGQADATCAAEKTAIVPDETSQAWIPESRLDEVRQRRRYRQKNADAPTVVQPLLPGIMPAAQNAGDKTETEPPKSPQRPRFLPGFDV